MLEQKTTESAAAVEKSRGPRGPMDYSKLHKEYRRDKDGVVRGRWVRNGQRLSKRSVAKVKGQEKKKRKANSLEQKKVASGGVSSVARQNDSKATGNAGCERKRSEKPRKGPLPIVSKEELHDFIEKHKKLKIDERVSLGPISNEARERIKAAAHVDVERVILDSGSIRHAFGKLSHNLDSNDLDDMKEIIETTRDIVLSPKKNRQGNPVIIFRKEEPNGIFLCEEYRAKKKELELQTAYRIKKNGQRPGAEKQLPANVRNVTAPSDNIAQIDSSVNKKAEKGVKKSAKSKKWIWIDNNGKIWVRKSVMKAWRQAMAEQAADS